MPPIDLFLTFMQARRLWFPDSLLKEYLSGAIMVLYFKDHRMEVSLCG